MYCNTILKLDLIIIIIQKYCEKYLKPDKNITKSKTIKFVLDQINYIKKTKDFKTLKSIFIIKKNYKIKDLKDWLSILSVHKHELFSKHFKLDVEIDLTKSYRTYVNLFSKLGNNKTKCDLKKSTKKISILFNLLFYDVILDGISKKKGRNKIATLTDGGTGDLVAKGQPTTRSVNNSGSYLTEKEKEEKIKSLVDNYNENQRNKRGKTKLKNFIIHKIILPRMSKNLGVEYSKKVLKSINLIDKLFPNSKDKINWRDVVEFAQSFYKNIRRDYGDIYPVVQQNNVGSCWINAILVCLMYSYALSEKLKIIIKKQRNSFEYIIEQNSFARIIPNALNELLILQYRSNGTIKAGNPCRKREINEEGGGYNCHISVDLNFVRTLITVLTLHKPGLFLQFTKVIKKKPQIKLQIQRDLRQKSLTLYSAGWRGMRSIDYILKDTVVTIHADEERVEEKMKRKAVGATGVVGYVSGYAGMEGQICKKLNSGNAMVKFEEGNTCAFPWDILLMQPNGTAEEKTVQLCTSADVETVQTQGDDLDNAEQVVADEQALLKRADELYWDCTMPDKMDNLTYVTPGPDYHLKERYDIALEDARITMKERGVEFLRLLELNDVLLNEGGTLMDTLNLIYILLIKGLGFTLVTNYGSFVSRVQTYTKIINKDESKSERITICIVLKTESQKYQDIMLLPDFAEYKLESMILQSYNQDKGEDLHVISVVTDYNNEMYYYNGWMNGDLVNPLKKVLNDDIEVDNFKFSLNLSRAIMFMFKIKEN
tara:strand:- start:6708 stop:9014 length:2307 start_codon:yes stop_codon:yes gene_type:complete